MTANLDKYWSEYYDGGRNFTPATPQDIKRILSYVPKSAAKSALDIGCGTGQLTRELYHSGYKVVGVDVSKSAIQIARSLSTVPESRICYVHRDFEADGLSHLPFSPYGLIICRLVYAFVKDKEKLLTEVKKVSTDNTVFIIITPLLGKVPKHKESIAVDPDGTRAVLEKYFQVDYYEYDDLGYFICTNS